MKQAVKSAARRSKEDLKWIRPAAQKRSREALEAILDAAQGLIEERLFDEVTVAEICEAANCSLPGFYRRFRDKEALLHALHSRHTEAAIATSEEALDPERWDGHPLSKILESLFDLMTSADYRASGLRVTASQRATKDDLFAERIRAIRSVVYSGMRRLLILRREEYRHPDPELPR
jgi:AcrR family transcriptional regulator